MLNQWLWSFILIYTSEVLFLPSGSPESAFLFQQRDTKISEILNNHIDTCTFELNFGNVTKKTAYPESTHLHETGTNVRKKFNFCGFSIWGGGTHW